MQTQPVNIGTRGSPLALIQANLTRDMLIAAHGLDPALVTIVTITTTGDRVRDRPLAEIGGKGLFTKEIEQALFDTTIDVAVHSMKDMPAVLPDGLELCCLLPREDPRDAFLSPVAETIAGLPDGAVVGSSSVRRTAQIKRARPDVKVVQYRGNVGTRLKRLHAGEVDATFLACAGLIRMGLEDEITCKVPVTEMLPAPAQGAIGLEIRSSDAAMKELLAPLNDAPTTLVLAAERAFLAGLDGSCRTPLAGHASLTGGTLSFHGMALLLDGSGIFEAHTSGAAADGARLGREAAEQVKALAGARLFT